MRQPFFRVSSAAILTLSPGKKPSEVVFTLPDYFLEDAYGMKAARLRKMGATTVKHSLEEFVREQWDLEARWQLFYFLLNEHPDAAEWLQKHKLTKAKAIMVPRKRDKHGLPYPVDQQVVLDMKTKGNATYFATKWKNAKGANEP